MTKKTTLKELGEMIGYIVEHMATKDDIAAIRKEMATKEDIAGINRRLDNTIQIQLDTHAGRIKKLETTVFK